MVASCSCGPCERAEKREKGLAGSSGPKPEAAPVMRCSRATFVVVAAAARAVRNKTSDCQRARSGSFEHANEPIFSHSHSLLLFTFHRKPTSVGRDWLEVDLRQEFSHTRPHTSQQDHETR